jgi:hypothetical protein
VAREHVGNHLSAMRTTFWCGVCGLSRDGVEGRPVAVGTLRALVTKLENT